MGKMLAAMVVCLAIPSAASAAATWQVGATQESTISDCVTHQSVIGAAVTPQVYEDYSNPPAANTAYYLGVQVYGVGDACAGQAADVAVTLPSGTSPSASASVPVLCYPLQPSGNTVVHGSPDTSGACPQVPGTSVVNGDGTTTYHFDMAQNSGFDQTSFYPAWAIPIGYGVELDIPVVTSAQASYSAKATVQMFDGNSDPVLSPAVSVIVGPASTTPSPGTPSVTNAQTTNITSSSAHIAASFIYNYHQDVHATLAWGTTSAVPDSLDFNISAPTPQYELSFGQTLNNLSPGCTYYWQAQLWDNTAHMVASSAVQSFIVPGTSTGTCAAPSAVGSGGTPNRYYARPPLKPTGAAPSHQTPPTTTTTSTSTSHTTTTKTSTTTTTTTTTTTSTTTARPRPPVASGLRLSGLVGRHPLISFRLLAGHLAGAIKSFVVRLPGGLQFVNKRKALTRGLVVRDAKGKRIAVSAGVSHGRLIVVLRRAQRVLGVSIAFPEVVDGSQLAGRIRHRKVKRLSVGVSATDTNHATTRLSLSAHAG